MTRLPCLALSASLVALTGIAGSAQRLHAQTPSPTDPPVRSIEFEGARSVDTDSLRAAIMTQETVCRIPAIFPPCWFGLMQDRHTLPPEALDADVPRLLIFYYRRGFREARVDAEVDTLEDGLRVRFRIDEGQAVRVARLEVDDSAAALPANVRGRLPVSVGDRFDLIAFEAARDTLRNRLRDDGYPYAEVLAGYEIPAESPDRADVRYSIVPGPRSRFGEIEVVGTQAVSPTVVHRLLTFGTGDIYRRVELLRSQRTLYELGLFRHIEISPRTDSAAVDTLVPVTVQVNEGDVHRVRYGIGVNSLDAVNAEGLWMSRNFMGGARRLVVSGRVANVFGKELGRLEPFGRPVFEVTEAPYDSIDGTLSVDFTQPWFFEPRMSLSVGAFVERRSVPNIFVRNVQGGYASVTRSLSRATSLSFGYRPERTALTAEGDLFFCVNYRACEADDIDVLDEPNWLAPIVVSFSRDRSNSLTSPSDGYTLGIDAEYGVRATGSDFAFARLLADARHYEDVSRGWVFAAHLRAGLAGLIEGIEGGAGLGLHPQMRFFAGGPNSVRGFAYYRLGPKVLTVDAAGVLAAAEAEGGAGCSALQINDGTCDATELAATSPQRFDVRPVGGVAVFEGGTELRFPLWRDRLEGATFVDFGQVWSREQDVDLRDVVFTPGVGVRYRSPVGPLRVDIAYNHPRVERLPVITTAVCGGAVPCVDDEGDPPAALRNTDELTRLDRQVLWNPREQRFLDRIQIHLSIGQAF